MSQYYSGKNRSIVRITLPDETWTAICHVAETYNLTRGEVIETLFDNMDVARLDEHLKAYRQIVEKAKKLNAKIPKTHDATFPDVLRSLNGLTSEHLENIAETAWKLQGMEGDYRKTPSVERRKQSSKIGFSEVINQLQKLSPSQLGNILRLVNDLKKQPIPPEKARYALTVLNASITGLQSSQRRIVTEAAWQLKGHSGDFEESRRPERRRRLVTTPETISYFAGLNSEQIGIVGKLIEKLKAEQEEDLKKP